MRLWWITAVPGNAFAQHVAAIQMDSNVPSGIAQCWMEHCWNSPNVLSKKGGLRCSTPHRWNSLLSLGKSLRSNKNKKHPQPVNANLRNNLIVCQGIIMESPWRLCGFPISVLTAIFTFTFCGRNLAVLLFCYCLFIYIPLTLNLKFECNRNTLHKRNPPHSRDFTWKVGILPDV